jgi:hypothetical protein
MHYNKSRTSSYLFTDDNLRRRFEGLQGGADSIDLALPLTTSNDAPQQPAEAGDDP